MATSAPAPDHDQSDKAIKNWLKSHVKVGTLVGLKRTQDGHVQFDRGRVLSIRPKNFNVGTQEPDGTYPDSGIPFDYSGKSSRDASVRLVMPTDAVLEACDKPR